MIHFSSINFILEWLGCPLISSLPEILGVAKWHRNGPPDKLAIPTNSSECARYICWAKNPPDENPEMATRLMFNWGNLNHDVISQNFNSFKSEEMIVFHMICDSRN